MLESVGIEHGSPNGTQARGRSLVHEIQKFMAHAWGQELFILSQAGLGKSKQNRIKERKDLDG